LGSVFLPLGVDVVFGALILVLFIWLCNSFGDYFSETKKKAPCSKTKQDGILFEDIRGWLNHLQSPLGWARQIFLSFFFLKKKFKIFYYE
jgi:hypothetical protein